MLFAVRMTNKLAILSLLLVTACAQPFMASATVLDETMRGAGATRSTFAMSLMYDINMHINITTLATF